MPTDEPVPLPLPTPRDLRDARVKSLIDAIPGSWAREATDAEPERKPEAA